MATDREAMDVHIPSAAAAIVAEFKDRGEADKAVDALMKAGFSDDQISVVARGAGVHDGVFKPGTLMITVHPQGRDDEVRRILQKQGSDEVTTGTVTATGEVVKHQEIEAEAKP
jgi:hypothetical protein